MNGYKDGSIQKKTMEVPYVLTNMYIYLIHCYMGAMKKKEEEVICEVSHWDCLYVY